MRSTLVATPLRLLHFLLSSLVEMGFDKGDLQCLRHFSILPFSIKGPALQKGGAQNLK